MHIIDRVYELNYKNLMDMTEEFSKTILVKPSLPNFTSDSPEYDIIKSVIHTGEILNIQDTKQDSKYAKVL